ncbi:SGNH/GDSL hydrolase family protein [Marinoscillum pacificum]|uniref:SGNH/GDSL hydrolase family protein n=1 Tax=Marinoscillum pacificum TaxID=392723 RepID=UPI002157F585|nr:SGNH/GDSL hydrolase family protein [Marinoscillum pacificum]
MKTLYLLLSLGLFSCENEPVRTIQQNEDTRDSNINQDQNEMDTLTYLALGDSYTIGESVDVSERWPVQLVMQLKDLEIPMSDPQIIATTGWTTDELLKGIEAADTKESYDLVSLLIGVNNQYRGYPIEQQKEEFEVLLKKAIQFANMDTARVFVVSIPDWGVTPFAEGRDQEKIATEIDAYNQVNQTICENYGVKYFDITPISRKAAQDESLVALDGLHPSGKMYTEWVELIFPWVEEIFVE